MSEEHYAVDDLILPGLRFENPVEVRIDITDEDVSLQVGPRDWHWKRGCPDIDGAGTTFSSIVPFNPDDLPTEFPPPGTEGLTRKEIGHTS